MSACVKLVDLHGRGRKSPTRRGPTRVKAVERRSPGLPGIHRASRRKLFSIHRLKRDSSLRKPTHSQEAHGEEKIGLLRSE